MFIVFEGISGEHLNQYSSLLRNKLTAIGQSVEIINFPTYDSFFGNLIDQYKSGAFGKSARPEITALLYTTDRLHTESTIRSDLSSGKSVIANRYTGANMAFQGVRLDRDKQQKFVEWIKTVESAVLQPDLTILLDIPADEHCLNMSQFTTVRGEIPLHGFDTNYMQKVREKYLEIAKQEKWTTVECAIRQGIIWTNRPQEHVFEEIWRAVWPRL